MCGVAFLISLSSLCSLNNGLPFFPSSLLILFLHSLLPLAQDSPPHNHLTSLVQDLLIPEVLISHDGLGEIFPDHQPVFRNLLHSLVASAAFLPELLLKLQKSNFIMICLNFVNRLTGWLYPGVLGLSHKGERGDRGLPETYPSQKNICLKY